MFDEEVAIARFLLCSSVIVFIVETAFANVIRPCVSHETMYLCIFYYLVANFASSRRQLPASSRSVLACLTRTALCSISLTFNYFLSSFGVTSLGVFSLEISAGKHADICTYTTLVFYGALLIHHPSLSIARSEPGSPGITICGFDLAVVLHVHGLYPKCRRASLNVRRIGGR